MKLAFTLQDQLPRLVGGGAVDLMCAGVSDTPQRRNLMSSGQMEALYQKWFIEPNAANPQGFNMPIPPELRTAFDRLR